MTELISVSLVQKKSIMGQIRCRKAAKNHGLNTDVLSLTDCLHCNGRSLVLGIAIDSGADTGKSHATDSQLMGLGQSITIAGIQEFGLTQSAALPNRPHSMDNIFGR
jgi:3-deoxy-D-arabino-heptulosonate 7-phosphate (DAHP) synthase